MAAPARRGVIAMPFDFAPITASARLVLTVATVMASAIGGVAAYAYSQGDAAGRMTSLSRSVAELQENARHVNDRLDLIREFDNQVKAWHDQRLADDDRQTTWQREIVARLDSAVTELGRIRETQATEHERMLFLTDRVTALIPARTK